MVSTIIDICAPARSRFSPLHWAAVRGRQTVARARRFDVGLLIASGGVASAQIGKAIISLPMIRGEMALGFDGAAMIVATFATLGALMGIGAGVVVGRLGVRRSLIGGMTTIALGNAIGAGAPNVFVLLGARIVEGVGFFGVVLAIPTMLARIVEREKRDFVMAAWSAYMPAGITLMLLAGPLLTTIGWRNLWLANALVASAFGILLATLTPAVPKTAGEPARRFFAEVATVVRQPRCLTLAITFFAYSCQIFSLAFALPLLLTAKHGVTLGTAGLLSALVLAVSTIGHISSAFLLKSGIPVWANIAIAFGFFALSAFAIYGSDLSTASVTVVAALALGIGGLAPGALYAAAPRAAPGPRAVPPTIGLLQQASNLGQFAGPMALGLWAENFGWGTAAMIVSPVALFGLIMALTMRHAYRGNPVNPRTSRT
jgi:predicted MFS family arabinose efflux permease